MAEHVCDGIDKAREAVDREDWERVIGMALNAKFSDQRCSCDRPILEELDLMCRCCLLENESQREKKLRWMSVPHAFEEGQHSDIGMCARCTRWRDDDRHAVMAVSPTEGARDE